MHIKRNYYCLVAGLQDINIDTHKLVFDQQAFKEELKAEVHPADYKLVKKLFLPYDNKNLLNLLEKRDKEFDEKGNFSKSFLEEQIKEPTDLPDYMTRFINAIKNDERIFPDMSTENELLSLFYDEMIKDDNSFLSKWYEFDMNIKNITTALMGRKHEIKYENQIIGSTEVSDIIRKSHAKDFGLSNEYEYIEELINIIKLEDIQEREKATDQLKWDYLEDVIFFEYFTIERLLSFTIRLGIVERWMSIDKDHGKALFKKLLEELQNSYKLPETFTEK
ncbi:MAG: DUF2764 family protein [Bacteroidales bacterium]